MLAAVSLFLLLNSYTTAKSKSAVQPGKPSWKQQIIQAISKNTLPIYLLHMIPLAAIFYLIKNKLFGFTVNGYTLNVIIVIPLLVGIVLLLSLIIVISLKKVPGLRKLVG
jgi:surface polysaccharide O-acyltransferase-like enzyme